MRELSKEQALEQLAQHKRQLLRHPDECVMCALAERRDSALVLRHEHHATVVLDRFGNRAGHLLVIARHHVEHATQLSWEQYSALQRLAYEASQALERVLAPKRVFIAALGSSEVLPMTFPHFHLHVVPVLEHDARPRPAQVFSWTEGVVTYDPEQARELVSSLQRAWPAR
jgi:diadenosine tetraphosphate (Ap4A) HIT family hydrolase